MTSTPPIESLTDSAVMAQVRAGDVGQLSVLFERHHQQLYGYCRKLVRDAELAQDIVQEVFVRVLKYRDSFQPDRPVLPWLFRTARNACFDQLRKKRFESDEEIWEPTASGPLPVDEVERREELLLLRRALERLPEETKELILLAKFSTMKYQEIAETLDCSVGAVKVRVHRAVKALQAAYSELAAGGAT